MNIDLSKLITKDTLLAESLEEEKLQARLWRDGELYRADVELNKVQDGMGVGTVGQWRAYRVALRTWPETGDFPSVRPTAPDA